MGLIFNPRDGITIIDPPGEGGGFWVGAPSAVFDKSQNKFLLYYRLRSPEKRGHKAIIGESKDGIKFKEIWSVSKNDLQAHSIERAHLMKLNGKFRLYISYDPDDTPEFQGWQIDLLEADEIKKLDPTKRINVLKPFNREVGSVKDPYVLLEKDEYKVFVSYHPRDGSSSNTGLAESKDGINFVWKGNIFSHKSYSWHKGIARLTSILKQDNKYYIFYDCENNMQTFSGEEKATIAVTKDFKSYKHLNEREPVFKSPHGTDSLRYITALKIENKIYFYYEFSKRDGSHELRLNIIDLGAQSEHFV